MTANGIVITIQLFLNFAYIFLHSYKTTMHPVTASLIYIKDLKKIYRSTSDVHLLNVKNMFYLKVLYIILYSVTLFI